MATITPCIQRRPVPACCALAFAIAWSGILVVIGGLGGIPGTQDDPHTWKEALP